MDKQVVINEIHSQSCGGICRTCEQGFVRCEKLQATFLKNITKAIALMPTCDSPASIVWQNSGVKELRQTAIANPGGKATDIDLPGTNALMTLCCSVSKKLSLTLSTGAVTVLLIDAVLQFMTAD